MTLFVFILIANWISVLPVQYGTADGGTHELLDHRPRTSTILALACSCSCVCPRRRHLAAQPHQPSDQGAQGAHGASRADQRIVGDRQTDLALARLFGNIFAGGIMVALIALFPPYIMQAPNAIWKTFDLFVGLIQRGSSSPC